MDSTDNILRTSYNPCRALPFPPTENVHTSPIRTTCAKSSLRRTTSIIQREYIRYHTPPIDSDCLSSSCTSPHLTSGFSRGIASQLRVYILYIHSRDCRTCTCIGGGQLHTLPYALFIKSLHNFDPSFSSASVLPAVSVPSILGAAATPSLLGPLPLLLLLLPPTNT